MSGELNGTDVALAVELVPAGRTFANVGGMLSHTTTFNAGAIELTNKSSNSYREIMDAEGLQSLDFAGELVFNDDTQFEIMRASFLAQTILNYQIARGALMLDFAAKITTWNETSPDQDKVTVSVSLVSHGDITDA